MNKNKKLQFTVSPGLLIRLALYFGSEILMVAALFAHYTPAGVFSVGFFIWAEFFSKAVRFWRENPNATRHNPNR